MVDACEAEQTSLLHAHLAAADGKFPDSATLAPFVPCAKGRLPYIRRALRLSERDVLWDLGCGDGRVLLDAAARTGCACVGLDVDAACLQSASAASAAGPPRFWWYDCDLTAMAEGWATTGDVGAAASAVGASEADPRPRPPTAVLCFLTGHGLSVLEPVLRREWETAEVPFSIATCVESLDDIVDHLDGGSLFDGGNRSGWDVCKADAGWGVFVVPPRGVGLDEWARGRVPLQLTPAEADATEPVLIAGLLSAEEVAAVRRTCDPMVDTAEGADSAGSIFDLETVADMEDVYHSSGEHRIVHLHGKVPECLQPIADKVRAAMERNDRWDVLANRPADAVNVRSLEYHRYVSGGGVRDPEHRDAGSLLTISVLLSEPRAEFTGGDFITWQDGKEVVHQLQKPGDAVLFLSEKRHNVSGVEGLRRTFICELWHGPANKHNRHR